MQREIDNHLNEWRLSKTRKPLLIRGARQVGKTYSVRELGKKFKNFLEINFEEEKGVNAIFANSLNPDVIIEKLTAFFTVPIIPGETLLFLDEIQACPEALSSLRFFYEKKPDLHVIAAGSLLEFILESLPSFGVGRLNYLFMHPMSFLEFLDSINESGLKETIVNSPLGIPINTALHDKLIDRLKTYLIIGGMPEVVQNYVTTHDLLLCQNILDELVISYLDDFAKYKKQSPVERLEEVFRSVAFQAGEKFKYSKIDPSVSSVLFKDALALLVKAGIIHKIYHSSARGIPLGAQIDVKKFKVTLCDVGLHQRLLGLDLSKIIIADDLNSINRGSIAEIFTAQEMLAYSNPKSKNPLYYWHREARNSNAEVDFVIQKSEAIIPVEVKAGTKGQMQSMQIFLNERKLDYGVRISLENFCFYENIQVLPLYAINKLFDS